MSSLFEDFGSITHIPPDQAFLYTIFIGVIGIILLFILITIVRRGIRGAK
jgi:hypothetical protein